MKITKEDINLALKTTRVWFKTNIPLLLGIFLFISIINHYISFEKLLNSSSKFLSALIAGIFGSIAAWNPINSYFIASEFWEINQNIFVITVFLVCWVTVWLVQIPAESYYFGKRYTLYRNLLSFLIAFVIGFLFYLIYNVDFL